MTIFSPTYLMLLGQIILGGYFIMSGFMHLIKLKDMTMYAQSKKLPMAKEAVIVTGLMLLAGGLGILLGQFVSIAITLLIAFLIPTTVLMHNFWAAIDDQSKMADMTHFMKNMALIGALLMLL